MLHTEAAHPQPLISDKLDFRDDGSFDLTGPPPLAEIADPEEPGNSYLVGLRPDGLGQIIMLEREKGGVVGRVVINLREGRPTRFAGRRRVPWHPEFNMYRTESLDGQLASAELLDQVGAQLSRALALRRECIYGSPRRQNGLAKFAGRLLRPFMRSWTKPETRRELPPPFANDA